VSLPPCATEAGAAAHPTWDELKAAELSQLEVCRIYDPNQFAPTWGDVNDRKVRTQAKLISAEIAQVETELRTSTIRQPTCLRRERPLKTGFLLYYLAEGEPQPFEIVALNDQTCAGFALADGPRYSSTFRHVLDRLTTDSSG
jgi:hypothetical protein